MKHTSKSLKRVCIVIAIVVSILTLSAGCGYIDRKAAAFTGSGSALCYKGVAYVQFTSGASVVYNKDGSIMTCSD